MTLRRLLGGTAIAAALGVGAWQGIALLGHGRAVATTPTAATSIDVPAPKAASDIVTVESEESNVAASRGTTPMAQRVAVVGLLNKRNGESRDLTLRPGQAVRIGDAIVRLRACEVTAPWETEQYTGAFVQLDTRGSDAKWRRAFSGWLFKERPALNVVPHPIYDVWPKSCTMSRPATGPDTVDLSKGAGEASGAGAARPTSRRRSSAPNTPVTTGEPDASPAEVSPSDAPSNAI